MGYGEFLTLERSTRITTKAMNQPTYAMRVRNRKAQHIWPLGIRPLSGAT